LSGSLIAILLAAAAVHAIWNLFLKTAEDRQPVAWWGLLVTSACCLAILATRPAPPRAVWGLLAASAGLEGTYYILLMAAYRVGDFSLVYPVARGAAPALLAGWAILALRERPTPLGGGGILLVVMGILIMGWSGAVRRAPRALALSLTLAVVISVYSVVDAAAVRRADPVAYTAALFVLTTLFVTPVIGLRAGWPALKRALRGERARILLIGVLQIVGYLAVLWVYARAPVAYAGAVRESSILLAALLGWLVLNEALGRRRVVGALVMLAGISCIALAR
jgi:drug/metabolite transporter (DMT)-like permease